MTDPDILPPERSAGPPPPPPRRRIGPRTLAGLALLCGLLVGAAATGVLTHRPQPTLIALAPAPIAKMAPWTMVAIKGEVAELFGGRFVLQDDSGRALIDPGPAGDDGTAVVKAETVTVQGRFDRGVVHAIAISHADGRTDVVGPPGPGRGPSAWVDRHFGHGRWFRADLPTGTGHDS